MSRGDSILTSSYLNGSGQGASAPLNMNYDKIDFSKPERFMRDVIELIQEVRQDSDVGIRAKTRTINASDAQMAISHLI